MTEPSASSPSQPWQVAAILWFGANGLALASNKFGLWPEHMILWGFVLSFVALISVVLVISYHTTFGVDGVHGKVGLLVGVGFISAAMLLQTGSNLQSLLCGFGLLCGGLTIGQFVGGRISERQHLWPLVLVMVTFDVWSVYSMSGVTQNLVIAPEAEVTRSLLVLAVPVLGGEVEPILGVGDVVVVGLLMEAAYRLELARERVVKGLASGFGVCLLTLIIVQRPVPALPFIAIAAVGALGAQVVPTRRDLGAAIVFCVLTLGALSWLLS